jgi:hypothetical protein
MGSPTIARQAVSTNAIDTYTGTRTYTYGTASTITGILFKSKYPKELMPEGIIEPADAFLVVAYNETLNRDDKIKFTQNSVDEYYKVNEPVVRGTLFKFARLIKWS